MFWSLYSSCFRNSSRGKSTASWSNLWSVTLQGWQFLEVKRANVYKADTRMVLSLVTFFFRPWGVSCTPLKICVFRVMKQNANAKNYTRFLLRVWAKPKLLRPDYLRRMPYRPNTRRCGCTRRSLSTNSFVGILHPGKIGVRVAEVQAAILPLYHVTGLNFFLATKAWSNISVALLCCWEMNSFISERFTPASFCTCSCVSNSATVFTAFLAAHVSA